MFPWRALPTPFVWGHPQTDEAELSYPWSVAEKEALARGSLPLWEPRLYGGGLDLYANGSSALLYPPRLLMLLLFDPARAHDLFSALHLLAAGIAAYLLARALCLGPLPSVFVASAWMLSTWNTGWLQLEVIAPLPAFLPSGLLAVHLAFTRKFWQWTIGAGLVGALTLVSGHILLLGMVFLTTVVYASVLSAIRLVVAVRARCWTAAILDLTRPLAIGVIAAGAAALVVLPTALALRFTQRVPFDYAELLRSWVARPSMFRLLFLPPHLPLTAEGLQYMAFVGSATAALALVGLFAGRGMPAWLGRGLVVITTLVAIGTPLTWVFFRFVPGFNVLRPYSRLMVVVAFGWALLAGVGLEWLLDLPALRPGPGRPGRGRALVAHALAAIVLLATCGQLIYYGRKMNPTFVPHRSEFFFPRTPLIEEASRATVDPRIGWPSRILPVVLHTDPDTGQYRILNGTTSLAVGLDSMAGYDSSLDRRAAVLVRTLSGEDAVLAATSGLPAAYAPVFLSSVTRFDLARKLGVTAVVTVPATPSGVVERWSASWASVRTRQTLSGADGRVFRLEAPLAGPRLVYDDEQADTEVNALLRFIDPSFPAERAIVIERAELVRTGLPSLGAAAGPSAAASVLAAHRGDNAVSVELKTDRTAWLLVPDGWAPGWSATVNGQEAKVLRVNYNQRAVLVPAGSSKVEMSYRSPGLMAGALVSGLTVVGCLLALGAGAMRRRSGPA